jgi:hypothetical protein
MKPMFPGLAVENLGSELLEYVSSAASVDRECVQHERVEARLRLESRDGGQVDAMLSGHAARLGGGSYLPRLLVWGVVQGPAKHS